MGEVVPRMRNLRLVGFDLPEDLGAFLCQRLDDQGLGHAAIAENFTGSVHPANWCICYLRPSASTRTPTSNFEPHQNASNRDA